MSVFCLFVLQAIISAIVVAVFLSSCFKYRYGPQYYYLNAILGVSVVLKGDSVSTGVHTPHLIEIIKWNLHMFSGQFVLVTWCRLGSIRQLLPGTAPNVSQCVSTDQEL